ncbi:MAG: hypothetical protein HOL02_16020 [Rhodospirillaceae bacterium]|nr:hypothetical protein [Rhodospirillaceae bacterium]MBT6511940.1 hypothetical protein [Rhodospirillaceae bacterium]MBT7648794.1 hypothetical protein [Rhodospirillaceae bacterium]
MRQFIFLPLITALMLVSQPTTACPVSWPDIRDPSDVAPLMEGDHVTGAEADQLGVLAARRQGVAAKLLELRYAIGKNAANAATDDADLSARITDLRRQVDATDQQLAFIDDEIEQLLAGLCAAL